MTHCNWDRGWAIHGNIQLTQHRRQKKGGGVKFGANIMDTKIIGHFKCNDIMLGEKDYCKLCGSKRFFLRIVTLFCFV